MDERVELVSGFATPGCLGHIKSTGEKLSLRKTAAASGEFHCARPWWINADLRARPIGGRARAGASTPVRMATSTLRSAAAAALPPHGLLSWRPLKHLHQSSKVSALVDRPTSAQHLHILVMLSTS